MEEKIIATFNAYTAKEALIYANANKMANILWELKHNFHRQFKHVEVTQDEVLEKLYDEISEIDIDQLNC